MGTRASAIATGYPVAVSYMGNAENHYFTYKITLLA